MKNVKPAAAALSVLLAGGLATNAAVAQEWEPEFHHGKLLPLPDGFPSGPISIVVVGDRGSVPGLLAVRLVEYSKLFTPVGITVDHRPDLAEQGSWGALKYAAEAEGGSEGYVNVIFQSPDDLITLHTAPGMADVGVGLDDLSEVISIEDHRFAVVQCKDAGWEPTWEALVEQIKANPGKVRYAGGEPGDRLDMVFAEYMRVQGLGSLYCDADVAVTDMEQLITELLGEEVTVLLVTGKKKLAKYKNAPTAADVGMADDPMSRTMQVVVPAGVDPLHVKWLHTLWWKTGRDSYFKAGRVLDQPVNLSNLLDDEESSAWNEATDERIEALANELGIAQ
jgi:tripartite-type tricarboxylate transporter receptor subunit TctC